VKKLVHLVAILFPAAMLFYPIGRGFYSDWVHSGWMMGYCGEFFRTHAVMPSAFNTDQIVGVPFPIFYGYLFYPLMGLFCTYLHPEVVLRGGAIALFALQFFFVRRALKRLGSDELLATTVACLVIWAIYPLTNLYNRSAITEFFGVGFLTCALCVWFEFILARTVRQMWLKAVWFGIFLTLTAGTHPITAVGGAVVLTLLLLTLVLPTRGPSRWRQLTALGVVGLLCVGTIAPWCYAVKTWKPFLHINATIATVDRLGFFPDSLDHWAVRLSPMPLDVRCLFDRPDQISTPYLDTQINLPLLVLSVALAITFGRRLRGWPRVGFLLFSGLPLVFAAGVFWLSVDRQLMVRAPAFVYSIQIVYRLVSYVNFGLLLSLLFGFAYLRTTQPEGAVQPLVSPVLLCLVLAVSSSAVVVKWSHAYVGSILEAKPVQMAAALGKPPPNHIDRMRFFQNGDGRRPLEELPVHFMSHIDYATLDLYQPLPAAEQVVLPICALGERHGQPFGETRPVTIEMTKTGYVGTDVLPFPWNELLVDGHPVSFDQLRIANDNRRLFPQGPRIAVPIAQGKHVLEHRFMPNRTWLWLYRLSLASCVVWVGLVVTLSIAVVGEKRRMGQASESRVVVIAEDEDRLARAELRPVAREVSRLGK
jgi:hypothetical protein